MGFKHRPKYERTQNPEHFGHIPGVPVGSTFHNRWFLHQAAVHRGIIAGIAGHRKEGCNSVVLSGEYEDDRDNGDQFVYTGCGGRIAADGSKPRDGPQTCDQEWSNRGNASLKVSALTKKPVRVIRGYKSHPTYAPTEGYRYDGLYEVEKAWMDVGKSGHKVCKFVLTRLPNQPPLARWDSPPDYTGWPTPLHFGPDPDDPNPSEAPSLVKKRRTPDSLDDSNEPPPKVARKLSAPISPAAPIPPTTNAAPARALRPVPAQSQANAVQAVDVFALMAEMSQPRRS
ncbi:PUA-like domain-containing protein [Daedaleopsis nitida]|nr:PUA-like domain-containing protein [Daedaleopsis nitida]